MARTSPLERKSSVRALGAVFIALVIFFVWLTYAFFDKQFVDYDNVTIRTQKTGVNLPENADIKLKGVIVGEVREIVPEGDGVKITLGMNPKLIGDVPRDVSAQILPKTLFGEKYIALIPPEGGGTDEKLQAGDEISQASVPIEVEDLLNDAYPLLTAVDPANLSYTLTAVSDALEGRGEQLGETLVTANRYLGELNPEVPQLVADLVALGTVSDGFTAALPDLGRLLENAVVTGNTVVAKRAQLSAFLAEGTRLSNTLTDFTKANRRNIPAVAETAKPGLDVLADYAPTFPCFLGAMRQLIPRLDSAFRDGILHIDVKVIPQPTSYEKGENLEASQSDFERASSAPPAKNGSDINEFNAAQPGCLDLEELTAAAKDPSTPTSFWGSNPDTANKFSSQGNPYSVPPSVYRLVNVQDSHGKFGDDSDFERVQPGSTTAATVRGAQPSMGGIDTEAERAMMNVILGGQIGTSPDDVPDVGSLLLSPVLRGAEVSVQ